MERIKNFILNSSYFLLDDEDDDFLDFTTREHGIVGNDYDSAGEKDVEEAKRICKLVNSKFSNVTAEWDTCDEWTNIHIYLK